MIDKAALRILTLIALLACAGPLALAQEPTNAADSATQPSPGRVILKEQFRYYSLDLHDVPPDRRSDIDESIFLTMVNLGLTTNVALSLHAPVHIRDRTFDLGDKTDQQEGVGDVMAFAKWRVYRNDTGALNTARLSLVGGMQIRSGDSPFTADAYNPIIGAAYTQILGRHGINASLQWMFTTAGNDEPIFPGESTADLFRYDFAYLFRVSPKEYSAETHGALYAVVELNGYYETNGDNELFVAPGLMYEARKWVLELSVQLPTWQQVEHRAETEYALIAGIRLSL